MHASKLFPGMFAQWVMEKTLTPGKDFLVRGNPFVSDIVSVRKVFRGQAATKATWLKKQLERNPDYKPSNKPNDNEELSDYPCLVRSVATGEIKARIINFETVKRTYTINGIEATPEQAATIERFIPQHKRDEKSEPVMFPYLNNLTNVNQDLPDEVLDEA